MDRTRKHCQGHYKKDNKNYDDNEEDNKYRR